MLPAAPPPTLTFGHPTTTITIPAGWRGRRSRGRAILTRGGRRVVVAPCPLLRTDRHPRGCVHGAQGLKLHPRLGSGDPHPFSIEFAEQVARRARAKTLAAARATGTALALAGRVRVSSAWEWDLPARYTHQVQTYGGRTRAEVVHDPSGDFLREGDARCWGGTSPAEQDDALDPRLELQEYDVPPAVDRGWQVAYQPVSSGPDGSRVFWSSFTTYGEADIAPDGTLRRITWRDTGQAIGRSAFRRITITFSGFPAALTPVSPVPAC